MSRQRVCGLLAGFVYITVSLAPLSSSSAQTGKWTTKTSMPTARAAFSTSAVNGKIYAIGGGVGGIVEEYDPATDTWTRKADMPTARGGLSTSVANGKIYAIGGNSGADHFATTEEYDPTTDTWTRRADMPTARRGLSTSVVNGKIYAIGGYHRGGTGWGESMVTEYDPAADIWERKADMPTGRARLATSVVDGKIYAIGGIVWPNPVFSVVEEYDPATDTWRRRADMPTARMAMSTSAVDGRIYAIGGTLDDYQYLSTVEAYDPVTDKWTPIADVMPTGRFGLRTSVVDGRIYAIGGQPAPWPQVTGVVEEYDLTAPLPDFNGDGMVDLKDLLRLVESWGQDDPAVDIGPRPFGDGVVDAADLEVLMGFWEQELNDPALMAHWALDEMEGTIAYDSVGTNDAIVFGNAMWQPEAGAVGGALAFDGADDLALTEFVLSPADGPFSVFAWVQGGAPGQAILSQQSGANWLMADALQGALASELSNGSRLSGPLYSEGILVDGDWHRVGFTWDGTHRSLYVDDVLAARDPQDGLKAASSELAIGCDSQMTPGTFWSGLIDDVRIHNRAVQP